MHGLEESSGGTTLNSNDVGGAIDHIGQFISGVPFFSEDAVHLAPKLFLQLHGYRGPIFEMTVLSSSHTLTSAPSRSWPGC